MRPLARGDAMQARWADGSSMKKVTAGFIKPNDRLTSFERLEIYNRQYWFRLKDSFHEDYPGLRAVLGDRRFEQLAVEYLTRFPSESFTLRNLGRHLVAFLEAEPRWTGPRHQLVLDMARLEWAHIEAFDNEARPPLKTGALAGLDAGQLRLKLQPHITLLQLHYEVDDFLIALKHSAGLRNEASNALGQRRRGNRTNAKLTIKRNPIDLAVHRHADGVYYKRLQPGQFRLLRAFQRGSTLEKACASLMKSQATPDGKLAARLSQWFEDWATLGWFCDLE
jgi:hypothetical protein